MAASASPDGPAGPVLEAVLAGSTSPKGAADGRTEDATAGGSEAMAQRPVAPAPTTSPTRRAIRGAHRSTLAPRRSSDMSARYHGGGDPLKFDPVMSGA